MTSKTPDNRTSPRRSDQDRRIVEGRRVEVQDRRHKYIPLDEDQREYGERREVQDRRTDERRDDEDRRNDV